MNLYEVSQEVESVIFMSVDPETGEFNEDFEQALEKAELDKENKFLSCGAVFKNLEAEEKAYKDAIQDFQKKMKVIQNRKARLKDWVLYNYNGEKYSNGYVTIKPTKGREAVEITDLTEVPDQFLKFQEPKPDKTAIKNAIKAGEEVTGAQIITNPDGISIK